MKSTALILICAFALTTATNDDVYENGCPKDWSVEQLIPHNNCNQFYQCWDGELVEHTCPSNLLFSIEENQCEWADEVDCTGREIPDDNDDESNDNGGGSCNCNPDAPGTCNCPNCDCDTGNGGGTCNCNNEGGDNEDNGNGNGSCNCNPDGPGTCNCPNCDCSNDNGSGTCNCGNDNGGSDNGGNGGGSCNCNSDAPGTCNCPNCDCSNDNGSGTCNCGNDNGGSDNGGNGSGSCNCNPDAPGTCNCPNCDCSNDNGSGTCNCGNDNGGSDNGGNGGGSCNCNPDAPGTCNCPNCDCSNDNGSGTCNCGNDNGGSDNGGNGGGSCNCNPQEAPEICAADDSDGVLVAHENCNQFFICDAGKTVALSCPDKLLFNPYTSQCDWPENVECGDRVIPDDCKDDGSGGDDSDNNDNGGGSCNCNPDAPGTCNCPNCDCDNGNGGGTCNCGNDNGAGDNDGNGNEDSDNGNGGGTCNCNPQEAPEICAADDSDSTLVAHENCNQFYICSGGRPVVLTCPEGLLFNPYTDKCDWPENVQCDRNEDEDDEGRCSDANGGAGNDDPRQAPAICASEDSNGILVAHVNCNQFYICDNGTPVALTCPATLLFNPNSDKCDWSECVNCNNRVLERKAASASFNKHMHARQALRFV